MSNIKQLSGAIRYALFVGAASTLASATAYAQEVTDIDRVEVTGTRIKRVDAETTQPVQVLTRADIEKTGLNNVFDILNNITSSDGSGLSTVTTQTNGSDGSQQISLRGLGADRTLVLVDGKRWATDIDATVDLSTIPVAIIERIDVLKDGASAIYGSDAIAGVINIITRKNFDGAQAQLYYGQTEQGDGAQRAASITIGANGERSNVVFAASFSEQESIMAGDRRISSEPFFGCFDYYGGVCPYASGFGQYGNFSIPGVVRSQALNPNANIADGIQTTDFVPFSNAVRYNFSPINYLQQPAKRANIFAAGRFDLTDNISAYARASYTKRTSDQQLAEVPTSAARNGSQGPQWAFSVQSNFLFNPFGVDFNTTFFRNSAVGPRHPYYDYDVWSLQMGLEGSFQVGERYFNWDLMAQRNDGQYDVRGENYINLFNLRNAIGQSGYDAGSDTMYCGASYATRIRNCVPYIITGGPTLGLGAQIPGAPAGRRVTAAEVQQAIDYVSYTQVGSSGNTTTNYTGNLSGDLFELPGGMAAFAVGFEYRRDQAFNQPDALVAGGGSSDNFSEPTKGQTESTEYFLEIVAPLVKDVTGFQELELSAAVRKSDFKALGRIGNTVVEGDPGSPTNMKFGLRWKPIDQLLVRASWGETFRAPSAFDLYQGGQESFPNATDPCRGATSVAAASSPFLNDQNVYNACVAAGVNPGTSFAARDGGSFQLNSQLRSLGGGNPFLLPESGTNFTAGLVWSPEFIENLDITVDYWKVELDGAMATRSAQNMLNLCYGVGAEDPQAFFCGFVERTGSGDLATVRTARFNLQTLEVKGIDFGIGYLWDAGDWGTFRFKYDHTHTIRSAANGSDSVGFYTGSPSFEDRGVLTVDWSKGDWGATWTARYLSDQIEYNCFVIGGQVVPFLNAKCGGDAPIIPATGFDYHPSHTGQVVYHDLQVTWKAPWDARIAVGARNAFGKEPPILYNSFAHSFDASYDLPGGAYWYAQYRQDF